MECKIGPAPRSIPSFRAPILAALSLGTINALSFPAKPALFKAARITGGPCSSKNDASDGHFVSVFSSDSVFSSESLSTLFFNPCRNIESIQRFVALKYFPKSSLSRSCRLFPSSMSNSSSRVLSASIQPPFSRAMVSMAFTRSAGVWFFPYISLKNSEVGSCFRFCKYHGNAGLGCNSIMASSGIVSSRGL